MSKTAWAWARPIGGVAILAVLVWRLGTGPILDGIRTINGETLVVAAGIALVCTVCCAWRWRLVARGLGVGLPLRTAIAAYYRSQFLNLALPGGVLGDVHRAVSHGRDVGDVGRSVRTVVWERFAGQVVQVVLAVVVLVVLPSPVQRSIPIVVAAVVVAGLGAVLAIRALPHRGTSRWARTLRTAGEDVRAGLLARRARWGIGLTSVVVVAGHTATFLVAARTAGSTASVARMLPIAMLVLLAMTVPTSIGGWGPREGVAAWLFAAAGLGAGQGVAVATVYGVMALAASLPGAAVLLAAWLRRGSRPAAPASTQPDAPDPDRELVPVGAGGEGAVRG